MTLLNHPLLCMAALLLLPCETTLSAQNPMLQSTSRRRAEAAAREETARRIAEAEARAALENNRLARESASMQTADLATKAKAALLAAATPVPAAEQQRRNQETVRMDAVMQNLSPEGRERVNAPVPAAEVVEDEDALPPPPVILAQNGEKVAVATPPPASSASDAPKPQPLKPTPLEHPALKTSRTVITCSGSTFFDANKSIGIFTENVRVYHPQFYLECDELEVFMKKNEPGAEKEKSETPEPGAEAKKDDDDEEGSIDKVIARGALVLIEKFTENGQDVQVGKCKHLTYDGVSGVVTLRNWPQVQRGAHLQIADEPGTIMTISPNGEFKSSNGRTRTEILQGDAAKPKTKGLRRAPEP